MVTELSHHALVNDIAEVYPGMMIAVPPAEWSFFARSTAAEVAHILSELAAAVPMERMLRSRRGPKKPTAPKTSGNTIHHRATKKLLDKSKRGLPTAAKKREKHNRITV